MDEPEAAEQTGGRIEMAKPANNGPHHYGSWWLNTSSERLPANLAVRLLRWWIPAALCVIGTVLLIADDFNTFGASAFAAFVGAGLSTWLINFLWRLGVSGDEEREREAEDRVYLAHHGRRPSQQERAHKAEHGHWPDEQPDLPASG
jgi:hypothetical protein